MGCIELYLKSDPVEAERNARQYLEKKFDAEIACYAARAQIQQRQFQKAFGQLQDTIQKDPSCVDAYLLMAQVADDNPLLSGKTPVEWLTLAVEVNPENPIAYLYRARYFLRNQQTESAVRDIEEAGVVIREKLVGKLYSEEILNKMLRLLAEYRSQHGS